jgi:hypothetical protein
VGLSVCLCAWLPRSRFFSDLEDSHSVTPGVSQPRSARASGGDGSGLSTLGTGGFGAAGAAPVVNVTGYESGLATGASVGGSHPVTPAVGTRRGSTDTAPTVPRPAETSTRPHPAEGPPAAEEAPLLFDLTFNAVQHAQSTVGHLRAAVHAMTSRWPTFIRCNGRQLTNDAASLAEAGIGLQCTLEISFAQARPPLASESPGTVVHHASDGRGTAPTKAAVPVATPALTAAPSAATYSKARGGLFHASISDPVGLERRRAVLRSVFDTIDRCVV